MSLIANVQARYSVKILRELTNPQDATATTFDATRLGLACTDVEAAFQVYTGVEYDDTDARHVEIAVEGVIVKLRVYLGGQTKANEEYTQWIGRLKDLAKVTGLDRIIPATNSTLQPTPDSRNGEVVRPWSDSRKFDHFQEDAHQGEDFLVP